MTQNYQRFFLFLWTFCVLSACGSSKDNHEKKTVDPGDGLIPLTAQIKLDPTVSLENPLRYQDQGLLIQEQNYPFDNNGYFLKEVVVKNLTPSIKIMFTGPVSSQTFSGKILAILKNQNPQAKVREIQILLNQIIVVTTDPLQISLSQQPKVVVQGYYSNIEVEGELSELGSIIVTHQNTVELNLQKLSEALSNALSLSASSSAGKYSFSLQIEGSIPITPQVIQGTLIVDPTIP